MSKMKFKDLLDKKAGLIKGPFGGDIKKAYFVPKGENTFKVYEQGVVYEKNINYGTYYIDSERYEKLKRFEVLSGDILLTGAGTLGELFVVPDEHEKGIINQALLRIRLDNSVIDKDYFLYYFKWYIKTIVCRINGDSVIPNLPPIAILKETDVDIPSIEKQRKIAKTLKAIENKIENNNKINFELEAMAKTIYDYWFLQYEFPNEEGKPYKSSGGKMVWNEELKREIPDSWDVKSLDTISDYQNGFAFYKEGYDASGAKVVDLGNVNLLGLYIDTKDDKYISLERYKNEKYKNYRLKKNDLIMIMTDRKATMDLLGKTGRIYKDDKYLLNQRVARIRCHDDFNVNYLYATLNGTFINDILKGRALGSVQKYINSGDITTLPILIPSENIMKKFGIIVDEMYQKMDANLQENDELASLRDFLLPLLMNGQVGFKE